MARPKRATPVKPDKDEATTSGEGNAEQVSDSAHRTTNDAEPTDDTHRLNLGVIRRQLFKLFSYIYSIVYKNPLALLAICIACTVGYLNYHKSAEMVLNYQNQVPIINPQATGTTKFQVTYEGKPVKLPYKILATIKNPGAIAVERKQVSVTPKITFPPNVKVLEANIEPKDQGLRANVKGSVVEIEIVDMLNTKETANLEVYIDGTIYYYPSLEARIPNVIPATTSNPCGDRTIFPAYFNLPVELEYLIVLIASVAPFLISWEVYRRWRTLRSTPPKFSRFASFCSFTCVFACLSLLVAGSWHSVVALDDATRLNAQPTYPVAISPPELAPVIESVPSAPSSSPSKGDSERSAPKEIQSTPR